MEFEAHTLQFQSTMSTSKPLNMSFKLRLQLYFLWISSSDLRSPRKSLIIDKKFGNVYLFSNHRNFVTIGSILEILDVLSSPDHVLHKCDTFLR